MTDDYKNYLAAAVLTDGKIVSYRLLSRALKVNVNTAKQMLYDFYSKQNAKKPKSVHATYLLTGTQQPESPSRTNGTHRQDGEDSFMQSSPFPSSMPEPMESELAEDPVPVTYVVLVREEELDKKRAEFMEITSIHIYSLEPGPIENMNMLAVCNQEITKSYSNDDPLERWKIYGGIQNPYIKRRTARYAPLLSKTASGEAPKDAVRKVFGASSKQKDIESAPTEAPKATARKILEASSKQKEKNSVPSRRGSVSEDTKPGKSMQQPSSSNTAAKKPTLKKEKSDIFSSFAKAKAKPKAAEESKDSTPAQTEDEEMAGMSEDEADADDTPEVRFDAEKAAEARKAREAREAKLRQMMEDDEDEPMEDAPPVTEEDSQDAPLDKEASKPVEKETVTVQGGRRRGRRRVMKKKTVKDEDGYLVTKEEAVWESFSEEDPEPKRPKPAPKSSTAKGKKGTGTGKYGQGSIASFFKKA